MALPVAHPLFEDYVDGSLSSVANAVSGVVRAPFTGRVQEVGVMLGSTTTTAATCTVSIAGTAITGGAFVIPSGAVSGAVAFASISGVGNNGAAAQSTITGANACNEGDAISFAMTGSGTGGGTVYTYAVVRQRN